MGRPVYVALTWLVGCCAAVAQTTLNLSEDLVRLGIASSNMAPDRPNLDAGPLFFQAVLYAQNHKIDRVIADQGSYYFLSLQYSGAHVAWDKLSNLTIDLQGSDLYFTHPMVGGMIITNSTNVVLENFTADYNPLPFTQVRVVSVNPTQQTIQFVVDGNWQNPSVLNVVFPTIPSTYGYGVEVHIFRNGRPIPGVTRMYASDPISTGEFSAVADPGISTSSVISQIRAGDVAFLGMRAFSIPVSTINCTGCTFRNISVYSSAAQGFEAAFSQSSLFERIYSVPKPGTDRLASNYAGILFTGMGPDNQVRLNRIIRTMDDGLEFDALFYGQIQSEIDSRTFVLTASTSSLLGAGLIAPNGSLVSFQNPSDGSIVASAVVASQTAPTTQPIPMTTVTFDRDLPAGVAGTLMFGADASQRAGNSVIERNALEEETDCCRGFMFGGVLNGVFHGNYSHRSGMAALQIANTIRADNLGIPPAESLAITNNVIDGANWTPTGYPVFQLGSIVVDTIGKFAATASPNQNISVTGNFIADSGSAAVWMSNTNGGSISGNYFLNPNINSVVESAEAPYGPVQQPLVVQVSHNVATTNNTVDQIAGRMWVTDVHYSELAAYAPGTVVRVNAYEIGTLSDPQLVLTDADGNVAPLAIRASTAHAIDVQIPGSAALGGAYLSLNAGGVQFFATLFLDSQDNNPALNGCTYELSPASPTTGANANNLPILVMTQSGCSYRVGVKDPFVSGNGAATGTGLASVAFAANGAASSRTTTVEIAGQEITLTQAAAGTPRPVIQAIADPWNYVSGLAPGEWVAISGTALAVGPPRIWNLNGTQKLPTSLGGVTVFFNGSPAALLYVSPTQINALVPGTVEPGSVQVVVQSNGVNSNAFVVAATATQPAIYALPNSDGSTFFVTAALAGTATLVGNSAVDPRVRRAAQPGDVLDLYMVGLGATADPSKFITDQIFAGAYPVSTSVTATVGGESGAVLFAGLTTPGLYLVRIAIPQDLSPGAQMIQVSAGSIKTGSSLKLLLASAP